METNERIEKYNRAIKLGDIKKNDKGQDLSEAFIHEMRGFDENSLMKAISESCFDAADIFDMARKPYQGEDFCVWWGNGDIEFMSEEEINAFLDACSALEELE